MAAENRPAIEQAWREVPEEQRGEASKLELTDFIDPAVAEPLIAVQDKLDNMPEPGGRRFPRGRR